MRFANMWAKGEMEDKRRTGSGKYGIREKENWTGSGLLNIRKEKVKTTNDNLHTKRQSWTVFGRKYVGDKMERGKLEKKRKTNKQNEKVGKKG